MKITGRNGTPADGCFTMSTAEGTGVVWQHGERYHFWVWRADKGETPSPRGWGGRWRGGDSSVLREMVCAAGSEADLEAVQATVESKLGEL